MPAGTDSTLKRDSRIIASSVPNASPITAASAVSVSVNVMPVWNRYGSAVQITSKSNLPMPVP
ncbi:hypothetical protein D3C81_2104530 [compost metagenome]